ncbi:hypothetical protein G3A43_06530 [Paraburkholderia aspalathi]|nr:hypothetical protein [Paraburkholderia aspalathi]MBK3779905.1 hypothetical protein [Paraburkholderia aspalathi]
MSKQISQQELAQIVTKLLTDPNSGELDEANKFAKFMTDIGQVVADHCGGEIKHEASTKEGVWYVGIRGNDSLPEDGGVWQDFDLEGELFEPQPEPTYVIYSFTTSRFSNSKGFWSAELKDWVELERATQYSDAQMDTTEMPFTPGRDAEWALYHLAKDGIISDC